MYKNNNKSFDIKRYAFQSFKHYAGKSMIFMISLAVTLVLSLLNILTSYDKTLQELYKSRYSNIEGANLGTNIMFGILVVLVTLVGALIIYNSFNIVIAKRTRHFGLLTLIGASQKQIKQS